MSTEPSLIRLAILDAVAPAVDGRSGGTSTWLQELLRADHPLSAEDKALLADYIGGKLNRGRGRPKATSFSFTQRLRDAVDEVRWLKEGGTYTLDEAIAIVCFIHKTRGVDIRDEQLREEVKRGRPDPTK
jgi:hypothetical protein